MLDTEVKLRAYDNSQRVLEAEQRAPNRFVLVSSKGSYAALIAIGELPGALLKESQPVHFYFAKASCLEFMEASTKSFCFFQ